MQARQFKPLQIGSVSVDRCVEFEGDFFPPARMFPLSTPEAVDAERSWMEPHFIKPKSDGGRLQAGLFAYVIRTGKHVILVDTCVGNDKPRQFTPAWNMKQTTWLSDLAAMGVPAEAVTHVLCTHLHVDHVGWNTRLENGRWAPTFPNARYIFHKTEYEYWESTRDDVGSDGCFDDSVLPVVEAGKADLVKSDYAIDDTMWLEPSPGHTPGHIFINLKNGGQSALFTGDSFHHPVQVAYPEWSSFACTDKEQSVATRQKTVERLCDTDTYMLGAHFAAPTAGRVRRNGGRWKLEV